MPRQEEKFTLVVAKIGHATPHAQLITTEDGEEVWIPHSQLHEIHKEEPPRVVMTAWIAKKKGFN